MRVETWREADGWHIRLAYTEAAENGIADEPFPTSHHARRAWKKAVSVMSSAKFVILDAPPEDLED